MIETLQYAVMTETPLVVALVQRLGPSTGGATQGAQGDVLLAEHATSGGYTIPVFAPSTAADAWELTQVAFSWAERLRTPVILLSDKEVGMTLESVDLAALPRIEVAARRPHDPDRGPFSPYASACETEAPDFAPVGGAVKVVATGSAHDRAGRLRKNSSEVLEILRRLQWKIEANAEAMGLAREDLEPGADTLVISYGISARAAREACQRVRSRYRVSFLELRTLFPIPVSILKRAAAGCDRIVIVEENLRGLYASAIEPHLPGRKIVRVGGLGGMILPSRVAAAVETRQ
jgi:2-oxoglutarate ferredoxin oxidoreductase subunit alpha